MIDTIDSAVLRRVAASIEENVPEDHIIHTVSVTLNGAHGGVDVFATLFQGDQADKRYSWRVS